MSSNEIDQLHLFWFLAPSIVLFTMCDYYLGLEHTLMTEKHTKKETCSEED